MDPRMRSKCQQDLSSRPMSELAILMANGVHILGADRRKHPPATRSRHTAIQQSKTVLPGDFGIGDKFGETKGQEFKPGGFGDTPATMSQFVRIKNGAVIQVQGRRPSGLAQ